MHIFIQEVCINFITTATYVCATRHNIIKSLKKKDKEENNSKTNKRTICKNGPHCIIKTPFPFVPHLISREFILGNMAFLAHIQQQCIKFQHQSEVLRCLILEIFQVPFMSIWIFPFKIRNYTHYGLFTGTAETKWYPSGASNYAI